MGLVSIFWPDHLPPIRESSYLVGWKISDRVFCVVTTIESSARQDTDSSIIGQCINVNFERDLDYVQKSKYYLHVEMDCTGRIPITINLFDEIASKEKNHHCVYYYTAPMKRYLQFYSLHSLDLDLSHYQQRTHKKSKSITPYELYSKNQSLQNQINPDDQLHMSLGNVLAKVSII